jgi:DUF438 domain-containing protein
MDKILTMTENNIVPIESDVILLQCANCLNIREWDRIKEESPGFCYCKSKRPWNTIKERPKNQKGFVRVYSHFGYQELKWPHFIEDPNGWKK